MLGDWDPVFMVVNLTLREMNRLPGGNTSTSCKLTAEWVSAPDRNDVADNPRAHSPASRLLWYPV